MALSNGVEKDVRFMNSSKLKIRVRYVGLSGIRVGKIMVLHRENNGWQVRSSRGRYKGEKEREKRGDDAVEGRKSSRRGEGGV